MADADRFYPKLMVLTITPLLGPLISKHGADVKEFVHRFELREMVFNECTHDRGSPFWAQTHEPPSLILKGKHFFGHDVGSLSNTFIKELSSFIDRRTDFLIPIRFGSLTTDLLDKLPKSTRLPRRFGSIGQNIKSPLRKLDLFHRGRL